MIQIATFISQEILLPRLKSAGVLVVYDPACRYRDLCLGLKTATLPVIDASTGSIESREDGVEALRAFGKPNTKIQGILVYVPAKAPVNDEEKQRDPFSVYGACGGVFPEGDGDEYRSLCLKAKPDHGTEIRRVFEADPNPAFSVIDAIGGGGGWPTLQSLLGTDSARGLLEALLVPTEAQKDWLNGQEAWVPEAKALFQTCLGLSLKTKGKKWSSVADELWRFVLVSEFSYDLPVALPDALTLVPMGPPEARPVIEDLCARLRDSHQNQPVYIERAEAIEVDYELPRHCAGIVDLGVRDTFPFEERSFLAQAAIALQREDLDKARDIIARRTGSVWAGKGENQAQWQVIQASLSLIETCDDLRRQLGDHTKTQEALVDFYVGHLREADRLHREFEQAVVNCLDMDDTMEEAVALARKRYGALAAEVQACFIRHLEISGWPLSGRLANTDVFDKLVSPRLQEGGKKTALILIDALRYELGVALEKQLSEDSRVALQPSCGQMPSVTPVGMASLLPGAGTDLRLVTKGDGVAVMLGEVVLGNVAQRMEVLRKAYGARFQEMALENFTKKKPKLATTTEFLVLRSNTMDSHMESDPETALGHVITMLRKIRAAVHRLKSLDFDHVLIATDHGFHLNPRPEAGDVCQKPSGNWANLHERCLLGCGSGDASNYVLSAADLGIRGDFEQVAGPKGLVAYRANTPYFHGGASLQELIVPVIEVFLDGPKDATRKPLQVSLNYRRGATRITTRLPVIEVSVSTEDLFSQSEEVAVQLEAHDKKGNVVGEPKPGGVVDPATGTINLHHGQAAQVTLKMVPEFEGTFVVKALDPATLTVYCTLKLETDYMDSM